MGEFGIIEKKVKNHRLNVSNFNDLMRNDLVHLTLPSLLLDSISEYYNKPVDKLKFFDMLSMYKSVEDSYSGNIFHDEVSNFANENKLSFFRFEQYSLMQRYINSVLD